MSLIRVDFEVPTLALSRLHDNDVAVEFEDALLDAIRPIVDNIGAGWVTHISVDVVPQR